MSLNPIVLHRWRLKNGLRQKDFGEMVGKSAKTVLRWENGHLPIPQFVAVLIAQHSQIKELKKQVPPPRKRKAKA